MPDKVQANNGLVAFFDILGYQHIIDNNDIEPAATIILEVLVQIPDMAKQYLQEKFDGTFVLDYLKEIETLLVSDSLLVLMPIDERADDAEQLRCALTFLVYCSLLIRRSFDEGLPLRGAVDYGQFFADGRCFAGKSIVNCYRLAQQMQCAGGALTVKCSDRISFLVPKTEHGKVMAEDVLYRHLVPLKDTSHMRLDVIDWIQPVKERWPPPPSDIRHYVIECFHKHNKDIASEVMPKVDNTEVLIRHALTRVRSAV